MGVSGARAETNSYTSTWNGPREVLPGGLTYGDVDITHLLGGSGGGGGEMRTGGSGGGSIKIVSANTLTLGGNITADGGKGGSKNESNDDEHIKSGGSGSGGAIYLKAEHIVINSGVDINATGGAGANNIQRGDYDSSDGGGTGASAGGGGRIYVEAVSSLVKPREHVKRQCNRRRRTERRKPTWFRRHGEDFATTGHRIGIHLRWSYHRYRLGDNKPH